MVRLLTPPEPSYIADRIHPARHSEPSRRRGRFLPVVLIVIIFSSASVIAAYAVSEIESDDSISGSVTGVSTVSLTLVYQHKDTHNVCTAGLPCTGVPPDPPHEWDHAAGDDGVFNTSDDCPHCSAYSAPAAISMVAAAYSRSGQYVQQDRIYDNGKSVSPEVTGDNEIQTHGVGMFDGTGGQPDEVQAAFKWAVGTMVGVNKHSTGDPITSSALEQYISTSRPVLWIDHNGWPVNQSAMYPSAINKANQGHAKVLAGYDDNGTATPDDDLVLVYDPWPEYNMSQVLPLNATPGPGGTYDPYWLPLNDVNLSDTADIFFVPSISIPEFGTILIPIVGILVIAAVVRYSRSRRESE